jgi:putative transposase
MPRAQRVCFPGALYHVYQRGNNKQDIFIDDTDRWHILKLLLESKKKFDHFLHCYVLMKNHFHVTIETRNTIPVSKIMHYIDAGYAAYFNARHNKKGHLFQGRFRASLVEKDYYLLELSRYIHLNPVKAGFVSLPEDYIWSSYRAYIGYKKDILVDTETVLGYFDANNKERAQQEYKKFVESAIPSLLEKKDWIEENLKRQRFIGSTEFVEAHQVKKAPGAYAKSA